MEFACSISGVNGRISSTSSSSSSFSSLEFLSEVDCCSSIEVLSVDDDLVNNCGWVVFNVWYNCWIIEDNLLFDWSEFDFSRYLLCKLTPICFNIRCKLTSSSSSSSSLPLSSFSVFCCSWIRYWIIKSCNDAFKSSRFSSSVLGDLDSDGGLFSSLEIVTSSTCKWIWASGETDSAWSKSKIMERFK